MDRKPCDILADTYDNFENRSKFPTMERVIFKKGVVLYGG
jgi:hypothetical protein